MHVDEIVGGAAYQWHNGGTIIVKSVFDGICAHVDINGHLAHEPVEEVASNVVRRIEMLHFDMMNALERAEMEHETLEAHARFDELLKDRKPRFTPTTHMLVAFSADGEPVAAAKYIDDASAAEVALRWLNEERTVKKLPRRDALLLFAD